VFRSPKTILLISILVNEMMPATDIREKEKRYL
jgi:hypothetical protein